MCYFYPNYNDLFKLRNGDITTPVTYMKNISGADVDPKL